MEPILERNTSSAEETERLGEELAAQLRPGDVVLLEGDLAAGKTTLVRGLLRGLGGEAGEVSSPSFVIVRSHACGRHRVQRLHHVDLYRLGDEVDGLREIGLEELLSDADAVVAVEWPRSTVLEWLPVDARCWRIRLEASGESTRRIRVLASDR